MESVFWNKERILFIECLKKSTTIKTSCYISLLDKVKQAMVSINGRGSCKNNCFFLIQDNISSNMAAIVQQKLADVNFEVLKHPAYSLIWPLQDAMSAAGRFAAQPSAFSLDG